MNDLVWPAGDPYAECLAGLDGRGSSYCAGKSGHTFHHKSEPMLDVYDNMMLNRAGHRGLPTSALPREDGTVYTCPAAALGRYEIPLNKPVSASMKQIRDEVSAVEQSAIEGIESQISATVLEFSHLLTAFRNMRRSLTRPANIQRAEEFIGFLDTFVKKFGG
jgi:hypothetical protein